jgi:hemerythrin-like domain-containing protein
MNDHKKVQTLFRQGERAKEDKEKLRAIVEQACEALAMHADIEEQHFYPVMREAGKETDLIAEAEVEHASAKQLIAELESGDPEEEQYAATFKVLGEYVKHHIKEEEGEIFPKARRARGDFTPLLTALQARDEAEQAEGTAGRGARAAAGSRAAEAEQGSGSSSARGREGRGRRSLRGRAGGEAETQQSTPQAGAESGGEDDVEQPRRGRRGGSEETGETETPIHGGDQEPVEEGTRGSRQGR